MKAAFIRLPRGLIMITIVLLFLAILFCVRAFIINNSAADAMAPALFGKSVVIDPGHGGWDPGMKGSSGSIEATVNLEIAQKLAEYCRQAGAFVSMTRETDNALGDTKAEDMAARVDLTEEADADIFISIHCNSFPGQRGAQVFYESGNEEGQALAEFIQSSIKEQLNNTERSAMAHADAYLLHQISGPAVICETGFLSHSEEEALLTDNEYQWDMAWAIFTGLVEYLNEGSQQETA